jgi:hypothetical protein
MKIVATKLHGAPDYLLAGNLIGDAALCYCHCY